MKLTQKNEILQYLNQSIKIKTEDMRFTRGGLATPENTEDSYKHSKRRGIAFTESYEKSTLEDYKKKAAALLIERVWAKRKIKHAMAADPYATYISFLDPQEKHYFLSTVTFGRYTAELKEDSPFRIQNPYIRLNAAYHRDDDLSETLLNLLLKQFEIELSSKKMCKFIPVTLLKNNPDQILNKFFRTPLTWIQDEKHSIGFCVLPKCGDENWRILSVLKAAGLIASPWEVAVNINNRAVKNRLPQQMISNLPFLQGSEQPMDSTSYRKLSSIATNGQKYPTQMLASCLKKILDNLPATLTLDAHQRIATMVELATTFYAFDYPKFAFSIYTTLHEVCIALLDQQESADFSKGFDTFLGASRETLSMALGIDSSAKTSASFMAFPALSGTNAYMLALQIALQMKTASGAEPLIQVMQPSYYEFNWITKASTQSDEETDIFVLSAGPIVNREGLVPGTDINRFIKRHIIEHKRTKPVTLIIDATSALYRNMRLDLEAQQLIENGVLSIIVNESHQKFGMVHFDSTQYGCTYFLGNKNQFSTDVLETMLRNTREDYANHIDLRMGAYISAVCGSSLEDIKEQHFRNGAFFREFLTQARLISDEVLGYEDMLPNLNELYFITFKDDAFKATVEQIIDERDSFGHFHSVLKSIIKQHRLSVDASDQLDCLIQSAQIYLAHHFTPEETIKCLRKYAKRFDNLSIEEQVVALAFTNNSLSQFRDKELDGRIALLSLLQPLIKQCSLLKGRQYYNNIAYEYYHCRQEIIHTYGVQNPQVFFKTIQNEKNRHLNLTPSHLYSLAKNNFIGETITAYGQQVSMSSNALLALCDLGHKELNEAQIDLMINNEKFCYIVEKMHTSVNEILMNLQNHSIKLMHAKSQSAHYYKDCFAALEEFYKNTPIDKNNYAILMQKLNLAKTEFCQNVLGKDRSAASKTVRYLLKGVINFIALLTFGVAHYVHFKQTGHALFFKNTRSQDKLELLHHNLSTQIAMQIQQ